MLDGEALKLLVPAVVAVLGWFAAHQFNAYRDRTNKQRDLRIQFLLEAYRRLEAGANRPEASKEDQDKFESALADIQLLGTKSQIEELMKLIEAWQISKSGGHSINSLLELLRNHLRKELKLETNVPAVKLFRFENRFPKSSKQSNK